MAARKKTKQERMADCNAAIREVDYYTGLVEDGIAIGPSKVLMDILTERRSDLANQKRSLQDAVAEAVVSAEVEEQKNR